MKDEETKKCCQCSRELDKVAYGLNKKLLGRSIVQFYCLACLAEYLDQTEEVLLARAEDFKAMGCRLFL